MLAKTIIVTQKSTKNAISMPVVAHDIFRVSYLLELIIATVDTTHMHENFHGRKFITIVLT